MTIVALLTLTILTVLLGRWTFGNWFNHLGLYGVAWGLSLTLFQVGLIHYYPLETETWIIIFAAWLAFIIGSAMVPCARYSFHRKEKGVIRVSEPSAGGLSLLCKTLWVLDCILIADAAHQVYIVAKLVGSVSNILAVGNLLYSIRVHEGLPGAIPYLSSLGLTGCLLAGFYTARTGRLELVATLPVLTVVVSSITNMSRALIIMGGILYVSGYFSARQGILLRTMVSGEGKIRRGLLILFVATVLVSGIEVIRSNRGLIESFAGTTTAVQKLGRGAGSFVTPSVIMYITAYPGVLNQYLKQGTENPPIGTYTFAPFWRFLSKLGFETYVPQHYPFYRIPVNANTGSYLRELHADYGVLGVVVGPLLLAFLTSLYWLRLERTQGLVDLVVMGHLYVAVAMSPFALLAQSGSWLVSLILGLLVSLAFTFKGRRLKGRCNNLPVLG